MTLKEKLSDWVDWDAAEFELAVNLGILEAGQESWLKNKGIFWSANRADDFLHGILQAFVRGASWNTERNLTSSIAGNRVILWSKGEA